MTDIREASGRPEDVALAFIRSCIADIQKEQMPPEAHEVMEKALLTPVMIAMALDIDSGIPFATTANALASVLRYAARLKPQLSSRTEGLQ